MIGVLWWEFSRAIIEWDWILLMKMVLKPWSVYIKIW